MNLPEYNPADDAAYQAEIDRLSLLCNCTGIDRPCDGLLAGGMCDNLHFDREDAE